jgi:hypothetical protein
VLSICVALYAFFAALIESRTTARAGSATIVIPLVIIVRWIIGFAIIEEQKATGGWISPLILPVGLEKGDLKVFMRFSCWFGPFKGPQPRRCGFNVGLEQWGQSHI